MARWRNPWRRRRQDRGNPRHAPDTWPVRLADGDAVPVPGHRTYREILAQTAAKTAAGIAVDPARAGFAVDPARAGFAGGWCGRCRILYQAPATRLCARCGAWLSPVIARIEHRREPIR
jgi:hypothetical protein